jgi:hypothetical protein
MTTKFVWTSSLTVRRQTLSAARVMLVMTIFSRTLFIDRRAANRIGAAQTLDNLTENSVLVIK